MAMDDQGRGPIVSVPLLYSDEEITSLHRTQVRTSSIFYGSLLIRTLVS